MKRTRLVFWLLLLIIGGSSSEKLSAQQSIPNDLLITLERSVCFGTCPDYKVTISADGKVTFEGREYVKVKGSATSHISKEDLSTLIAAFDAASYFSLKDKYMTESDGCPEVWTDNPRAVTSIRINGKSKTINHYYGCQEHSGASIYPTALTTLETKIDKIVGTTRWIK